MSTTTVSKANGILSFLVKAALGLFFVFNIVVMLIAFFDRNNYDEAPIGSFDAEQFNEGWKITYRNDKIEDVSLPMYVNAEPGEKVILSNRLPADLSDGMNIMLRASMEDVAVYVEGEKRAEYSTDSVRNMSFYIPSAYIVIPLDASDSSKTIDINITIKTKGSINSVILSHGNNGWYSVIRSGLPVTFISLAAFIIGVIITVASAFLGRKYKAVAAGYMGLLVMDVTMWMFSESILRQLLFSRPSLSQYFSYITLELVGALACLYFDEVQHGIYHRRYLVIELITVFVVGGGLILHFAGVAPLYTTLPVSHILEAGCGILILINIITDIRTGRIGSYRINMLGGIFFIVFCLIELAGFYYSRFMIFGGYVCIGLIGLVASTVIQTAHDIFGEFRANEKRRLTMMNNTIETIAGAIDAKDEYTGGHSERVGMYASLLARQMKDSGEYDIKIEDIVRIHYIGLVHDIGKIGVADTVLNKAGKLTSEEFSLMKRHTEIGFELMSSMGDEIEGVLDGIRHHHERYDGTGYPDGLAGEDIPLVARILCLADSYDAMTSNRVYRKRLSAEEVRNEIMRCRGSQFDPKLTDLFVGLIDRGKLREKTVEGMAVNESGIVMKSAMLESRLQSDLLDGKKILHPSHVRMICYVIKLMEKKGNSYRIIFAGPSDEVLAGGELTSYIKKMSQLILRHVGNHDLTVRYTDRLSVIALFNRTDDELESFVETLTESFADIRTQVL